MLIRTRFALKRAINKIIQQHNLQYIRKNIRNNLRNDNLSQEINENLRMNIDTKLISTSRKELLKIFDAGVSAVLPGPLIRNKVKLDGENLVINDKFYPLTENVYLVGFGKAIAGMAYSMEMILGDRLKKGIISVPKTKLCTNIKSGKEFDGLKCRIEEQIVNLQMLMRSKVIGYYEGAENNQPDDASLASTEKIVELVHGLGENDTLLVLVSGGGSALLFQPKSPLNFQEKKDLCKSLQNAGASITELNCVRKQLSNVKGGGLAKLAYPAKIISLIMSDIVGDPLDFIASGPTCPISSENPQLEAIEILKKYKLYNSLGNDTKTLLTEHSGSTSEEMSMIEEGKFKHVENIVIANNTSALEACKEAAEYSDLESIILTNSVEGDIKDVSFAYSKLANSVCKILEEEFSSKEDFINEVSRQNIQILKISEEKLEKIFSISTELRRNKGLLLLAGGEPTVIVQGSGKGGRNQELALRFSLDWLSKMSRNPILAKYFVIFLSVGTDGQDGPTDAAGAFGHPVFRPKMTKIHQDILKEMKETLKKEELEYRLRQIEEMLPENVLKRNDCYNFYSKFECGKNLVKTGLTGTNVMDLHFIYLRKRDCEYDFQDYNETSEECDFLFDDSKKNDM